MHLKAMSCHMCCKIDFVLSTLYSLLCSSSHNIVDLVGVVTPYMWHNYTACKKGDLFKFKLGTTCRIICQPLIL